MHVDFVIDDLNRAIARAASAGAIVERIADRRPVWRLANLADAFGNGFDLIGLTPSAHDILSAQSEAAGP